MSVSNSAVPLLTSSSFPRTGKNVFQIWNENGKRVHFLVQKSSWARDSYFLVTQVEVSPKQLEYFDRTGNIYGRAFGFFYYKDERVTKDGPTELRNPGVFKWRRVHEKEDDVKLLWDEQAVSSPKNLVEFPRKPPLLDGFWSCPQGRRKILLHSFNRLLLGSGC
jgi:hypothetical protein